MKLQNYSHSNRTEYQKSNIRTNLLIEKRKKNLKLNIALEKSLNIFLKFIYYFNEHNFI